MRCAVDLQETKVRFSFREESMVDEVVLSLHLREADTSRLLLKGCVVAEGLQRNLIINCAVNRATDFGVERVILRVTFENDIPVSARISL
jgi:hypothetical protein